MPPRHRCPLCRAAHPLAYGHFRGLGGARQGAGTEGRCHGACGTGALVVMKRAREGGEKRSVAVGKIISTT